MANKKVTVKNTSKGIRGFNALTGYVELNPGESRDDIEFTDAEYKNADSTGYFEFGGSTSSTSDEEGGDDLPTSHKGLDALAAERGVTFGADVKTVADKQAALTAAAGTGTTDPGAGAQPDELDKMNDDDLRATTAALTGKSVEDLKDTDREQLLKLARGQE